MKLVMSIHCLSKAFPICEHSDYSIWFMDDIEETYNNRGKSLEIFIKKKLSHDFICMLEREKKKPNKKQELQLSQPPRRGHIHLRFISVRLSF